MASSEAKVDRCGFIRWVWSVALAGGFLVRGLAPSSFLLVSAAAGALLSADPPDMTRTMRSATTMASTLTSATQIEKMPTSLPVMRSVRLKIDCSFMLLRIENAFI